MDSRVDKGGLKMAELIVPVVAVLVICAIIMADDSIWHRLERLVERVADCILRARSRLMWP